MCVAVVGYSTRCTRVQRLFARLPFPGVHLSFPVHVSTPRPSCHDPRASSTRSCSITQHSKAQFLGIFAVVCAAPRFHPYRSCYRHQRASAAAMHRKNSARPSIKSPIETKAPAGAILSCPGGWGPTLPARGGAASIASLAVGTKNAGRAPDVVNL